MELVCLYTRWYATRRLDPITVRERAELRLLAKEALDQASALFGLSLWRPTYKKHKMSEAGDAIGDLGSGINHSEQKVEAANKLWTSLFRLVTNRRVASNA